MPTHDIIDNRKEILVDHINRILSSTEAARFAVGYFFLSGLTRRWLRCQVYTIDRCHP